MSIHCQCASCGGRFQAPTESAGMTVECPKCKAAIRVPNVKPLAGDSAADRSHANAGGTDIHRDGISGGGILWLLRDAEGGHHGPMSKADLDSLVASGRLDGLCQVRRADWEDWCWIETVYEQFVEDHADNDGKLPPGGGENLVAPEAARPRLQECPDCGKIVSRRAAQCPNCGCPITAIGRLHSRAAAVDDYDDIDVQKGGAWRKVVLAVLLSTLLALLLGIGWIGWQLWQWKNQAVDIVSPLMAPNADLFK